MDVSELLAQKHRLRAERNEAPAEPEFVLTAREFDHLLRKAFAERERSLQAMIEKKVGEAISDWRAFVVSKISEHQASKELRPVTREVIDGFASGVFARIDRDARADIAKLRKEFTTEIEKLRAAHDLRISALLAEIDKLQRGLGDNTKVIDLPARAGRG